MTSTRREEASAVRPAIPTSPAEFTLPLRAFQVRPQVSSKIATAIASMVVSNPIGLGELPPTPIKISPLLAPMVVRDKPFRTCGVVPSVTVTAAGVE